MPYPLIENGRVVQLSDTEFPINDALTWGPLHADVQVGDTYDGTTFRSPSKPTNPSLADRLDDLAAERYLHQSGGVWFQASGASMPSLVESDAASLGFLTSSYVAATGGLWLDGSVWKMEDGSFVPLTVADMKNMAAKVLAFVARCFSQEAALAAALAKNVETDITAGWPSNL